MKIEAPKMDAQSWILLVGFALVGTLAALNLWETRRCHCPEPVEMDVTGWGGAVATDDGDETNGRHAGE